MRSRDFKTPEQIAAAKAAVEAASTKADLQRVWAEHYMHVGHKVLGRLLMGRDPEVRNHYREDKD